MMLLAFASIIAYSSAARGFTLQPRGGTVQVLAVCSSSYNWMANSLNQSPCQVVANVDASCNAGSWQIPVLNSSDTAYTPPTSQVASFCTCSWASYNLISACGTCQGFGDELYSWSDYSIKCAGQLSDTYIPSNLTLLQGTLIPFWATTNPTTWTNGIFNVTTAQSINSENRPDVGEIVASKKSTPVGAIVGGVIGGIVVLLAAILVGIYLMRRSRRSSNNSDGGTSALLMANHTHLRSHSDVTAISNNVTTPIFTSMSSSPMRPPSSPTIRTHASSSIRSFPFFNSRTSTVITPSMRQQSPPPPPASVHRDETTVEPFLLAPSNNTRNLDTKQADGSYPVYDPPTAPPPLRMDVRPSTPTQGGRTTRYNPPAYEQTPETGGASSSRRSPPSGGRGHGHSTKGSADTQHSLTSSRNGSTTRVAMANVVTTQPQAPVGTAINTRLNNPSANTSTNVNTGHGRQMHGNPNDRRRGRDTDDLLSARDIA